MPDIDSIERLEAIETLHYCSAKEGREVEFSVNMNGNSCPFCNNKIIKVDGKIQEIDSKTNKKITKRPKTIGGR